MSEIIYKAESYSIISACFEVHNKLGKGFKEIVYKDALELEFIKRKIPYQREKDFEVLYDGKKLPHCFSADFTVYDKILLEAKATSQEIEKFVKQTLNYVSVCGFRLGIIVNFGCDSLVFKRIVK